MFCFHMGHRKAQGNVTLRRRKKMSDFKIVVIQIYQSTEFSKQPYKLNSNE